MPRRRPAQVRAGQPIRQRQPVRHISGISAATSRAVAEFERKRYYPGAIAEALAGWARFVRAPIRAIALAEADPVPCPCCASDDPAVGRAVLRTALHALPAKAARELLALVRPLDELYLARSIPSPDNVDLRSLLTTWARTRLRLPRDVQPRLSQATTSNQPTWTTPPISRCAPSSGR